MINDHNPKVKLSKIQEESLMLLTIHSGETQRWNRYRRTAVPFRSVPIRSGPVPFHISDRPVYRSTGLDRQTGRLPMDRRPVGSFFSVCMLIAEKNIIENEYRRIDVETNDKFPCRFGDVSFR
jgi:hypothetical protein